MKELINILEEKGWPKNSHSELEGVPIMELIGKQIKERMPGFQHRFVYDQDSNRLIEGYVSNIPGFPKSVLENEREVGTEAKALAVDISHFGNLYRILRCNFENPPAGQAWTLDEEFSSVAKEELELSSILDATGFVRVDKKFLANAYSGQIEYYKGKSLEERLFSYL